MTTVEYHKKMLNRFLMNADQIGCLEAADPFIKLVNSEFSIALLWRTLNSYKQFEHDEQVKKLLTELYPYFLKQKI